VVPPEGERLLHVFFESARVPPAIVVRWEVEEEPDGEWSAGSGAGEASAAGAGEAPGPRRRSFSALLVRRYLLQRGLFSELEARVALGERLPKERPEGWTEPRVTAVGGGGS